MTAKKVTPAPQPEFVVELSRRDRKRLEPHLSGWNRLNEMLVLGEFTNDDLRKLIALELEGSNRRAILTKLAQRIVANYRANLNLALAAAHETACSKKTSNAS